MDLFKKGSLSFFLVWICVSCKSASTEGSGSLANLEDRDESFEQRKKSETKQFLEEVNANSFFQPAGLIEGRFGGRLVRLLSKRKGLIIRREQPKDPSAKPYVDESFWNPVLNGISVDWKKWLRMSAKADWETFGSPVSFFTLTGANIRVARAFGFEFDPNGPGVWVPTATEFSGRIEYLNSKLEESQRIPVGFYSASAMLSAREYVENFANYGKLPIVELNAGPMAMHDWLHYPAVFLPIKLVETYRQFALDALKWLDYLEARKINKKLEKFTWLKSLLNAAEAKTIKRALLARLGRTIDADLGNFYLGFRGDFLERERNSFRGWLPATLLLYENTLIPTKKEALIRRIQSELLDPFLELHPKIAERRYLDIAKLSDIGFFERKKYFDEFLLSHPDIASETVFLRP